MLTAYFSYLVFARKFSWMKIGAVMVTVLGIGISCTAALIEEKQNEELYATASGILLLVLSTTLAAFQNVLDERLLQKDKDLSILDLTT